MCCQLLWASDFNSRGFHAFCFLSGFLHHSYDKVLEPAAAHSPHPLHCCHAGRFAVCCAFASKPFFFHWCCSRFATCAPCPCPSVAVPGVRALSRRVAWQHWPRWRWRCGGIVVWRAVPKSRGWPWRAASLCRAEPKKRGHCERVAASARRCTLPLWLRRYCATPCLQARPPCGSLAFIAGKSGCWRARQREWHPTSRGSRPRRCCVRPLAAGSRCTRTLCWCACSKLSPRNAACELFQLWCARCGGRGVAGLRLARGMAHDSLHECAIVRLDAWSQQWLFCSTYYVAEVTVIVLLLRHF